MNESWPASHIGRFRVDGVLGRGGMGVVLRAFDPQLQRAVAIKLLDAQTRATTEEATIDLRADGDTKTDILSEARVLAQINHPNVLAIHEIGSERGRTFLVMEMVEGIDVDRWLESAPRSRKEIYRVFTAAARGLAAVHARNIVHRDFKPENVLISGDDRVRVCDFGIAAFAQHRDLVRVGAAGTPRYSAPEIWRSEPPTARSDMYSFAVAITRAICGTVITEPPEVERELTKRAVDSNLRNMILRSLDPEPNRRPGSMDEWIGALEPPARKPSRWKLAAGVGLAGSVIGIGIALAISSSSDDASDECGNTEALLAARWNDAERARVRSAITAINANAPPDALDRIIDRVDHYSKDWSAVRTKVCNSQTPAAQRAPQLACLDRRLYEISATISALQQTPSWELAQGRSNALPDLGACIEATTVRLPEGAKTREAVERLTAKVVHLHDQGLAMLGSQGDQKQLEDAEREAEALHDYEMVIRVRTMRAVLLRNAGRSVDAAKLYEAAYELATRHHYDNWAAVALTDAAAVASLLGDLTGANTKLRIARGLVENAPGVTVWTKLRVYSELAENSIRRDEYAEATEALDQAQKTVDRLEPRDPLWSVRLSVQRIRLLSAQNKLDEGLKLAQKTRTDAEALGRQGVPDLSTVLQLTKIMELRRGNRDAALAASKDRQAMLDSSFPEDHADRVHAQSDVADTLLELDRYDEAVETLEKLIERSKTMDVLADDQHVFHSQLSRAYQLKGNSDKAFEHAQLAIDLARMHFGQTSEEVGANETDYALLEIESGELDRAATHLRVAEDALAKLPSSHRTRLDLVATQIALLIAKGDYAAANQLATRAIALLNERRIQDARGEPLWLAAAAARSMLGEHKAALDVAQRALANATARNAKPSDIANAEAEVAKARYGLGQRDEALATLRRVAPLLAAPGNRISHGWLTAWLRSNRLRL
ncbi:MAG: protein kinase [Kofleriaceae bacterium]